MPTQAFRVGADSSRQAQGHVGVPENFLNLYCTPDTVSRERYSYRERDPHAPGSSVFVGPSQPDQHDISHIDNSVVEKAFQIRRGSGHKLFLAFANDRIRVDPTYLFRSAWPLSYVISRALGLDSARDWLRATRHDAGADRAYSMLIDGPSYLCGAENLLGLFGIYILDTVSLQRLLTQVLRFSGATLATFQNSCVDFLLPFRDWFWPMRLPLAYHRNGSACCLATWKHLERNSPRPWFFCTYSRYNPRESRLCNLFQAEVYYCAN